MAPRFLFLMLGSIFYLGMVANGEDIQKADLKSLHIISDIKYRFATTQVSMIYYNPHNSSISANLHINMPRKSFISNFSMEIDGNVTVGEVKEKSVARDIYKHAVETGQGAGYVEVKHRFTNVFDISVNVEPKKYITYNLTYQELLTRQNSKYRHVVHLSNGEIIDDFLVEIFIKEPQDIIDVLVPEITDDKLTDIAADKELDSASIEYINSKEVYIKYNPSRKQQEEISEKHGVAGLLRVEYDVDHQNNSNLIYAVDGYFVHFFTSDAIPSLPKNIIFMLDVSGSMRGTKIDQLKKAMESILDQLDPELDKFLIGTFSGHVSWMGDEFLVANKHNKELGKTYSKSLLASGSTNINGALLESIDKHKPDLNSTKKSIIVFLTDGDPTTGVTNREQIKKNVREANQDISLFALCFGSNCDSKFLRELATENGGFNRKIYVDSDSKLQIENLYKEISNILLKDITFVYLDGAVNTSSTSFSNYFKGSELVVSGVLLEQYRPTINVSLTMTNCWGFESETFELEVYDDTFTISDDESEQNSSLTSIQSFSEITEKTYVYLTLQQLLKEDRTEEVRHDILELALKYNFVTPLTSMVVTKSKAKEELFEEEDEASPLTAGNRGPSFAMVGGIYRHRPGFPPATHIPHVAYHPGRFPPATHIPPLGRFPPATHIPPLRRFPPATHIPPYFSRHRGFTTSTTTSPRPTSTPVTPPPPTTTTTAVPFIPHLPGVLIRPLNCSIDLCFTHSIQCSNNTEIDLLFDRQEVVSVHGEVKKASKTNCLETLKEMVIRKPSGVAGLGPQQRSPTDIPKPRVVHTSPAFSITVNQYTSANAETFLSLHFKMLAKLVQPNGMLSEYANEFQCIEKSPNQMKLSNKAGLYNKVSYQTASGGLSHCYTM